MLYWVALAVFLSGVFLRRRISRKWIDLRGLKANTDDAECPLEDLVGKTVIITGGNVGLGYETTLDLARRGCSRIVLGCRNVEQGREAAVRILQEGQRSAAADGNNSVNEETLQVDCIHLDLASLASVRQFAETVQSNYRDNIHALILNAGVWVPMDKKEEGSASKTEDGFEIHFGVNHLAHFLLVRCLLDHLEKQSNHCRIVFVSSSLLKAGKINFESQDFVYDGRVESEDPTTDNNRKVRSFAPTGYCDSKLMNALTCRHLATLSTKISTYSLCPGFCRSSLGRNVELAWIKKMLITPVFLLIQRTSAQGAQNIVFCTITKTSLLKNGALYSDGEIAPEETAHMDSLGPEAPKRLWDLSEKLVDTT